jgi:hypothetical protein
MKKAGIYKTFLDLLCRVLLLPAPPGQKKERAYANQWMAFELVGDHGCVSGRNDKFKLK